MTLPTITYGAKWQTDCGDRSEWSADGLHEDGNTATLTIDSGTICNINVTNSVGNKSVYYDYSFNPTISSTTYGKIYILYKTSDSSIKATVALKRRCS